MIIYLQDRKYKMASKNSAQIVPNISDAYERHRGVYLKSICDKYGQLLECYKLLKCCRDIASKLPDISFEYLNVLVAYELKKESCKHRVWFGSDNLINDVGICMTQHLSDTGLKKENY